MNDQRYYPLFLLLLSATVFLTGLGARDFWAPVEPRYGEIARVMFLRNEWIVPTVNGDLYTDKPIFYFWLVLIFSKVAGAVDEWTVRVPAALGAIGLVLTTYKIGKDFFTPRVGLISAAVLTTSARVIWEGRWAHLDALFTFFFTLAMYFAARSLLDRKPSQRFLWSYAGMALAVLTKGLIGVVLPALVLVSFVLIRKDWRLVREARLLLGMAIFLLIAAPWFLLVNYATDGKWLSDFFYLHHIKRYTAGIGHREPVYYYLKTLPLDFLPWTIFCAPALFSYSIDLSSLRQPRRLFFVLWFAAVLLFFTVSDTKRDLYLLPLFPPLALFVANYIEDLTGRTVVRERLFKIMVAGCFALVGVACLAAPAVAWSMRREALNPILPFAFVMAAGSFWVVYATLRQAARLSCAATCATMTFGVIAAALSLLPYVNSFKSPRPVAEAIKRLVPTDSPLSIFSDTMHDYNYYAERASIPVITQATDIEPLRGYLLIKEKDLIEVGARTDNKIPLDKRASGRGWYLLPLKP